MIFLEIPYVEVPQCLHLATLRLMGSFLVSFGGSVRSFICIISVPAACSHALMLSCHFACLASDVLLEVSRMTVPV